MARKEMSMSRTVINLRDDLVQKVQRLTGLTKKVEIVNLALEQLVQQKELEKILDLKGSIQWKGNLRIMRKNRFGSR